MGKCWRDCTDDLRNQMIRQADKTELIPEPQTGRPSPSGEAWLGHNRSGKRKLWERLNPRHRKELRIVAEALALQQTQGRLPEPARSRLTAALGELERVMRKIASILAEVARRTPPPG
jgi:hypothetical protein